MRQADDSRASAGAMATVAGPDVAASVSGGAVNKASGQSASVSGGIFNEAAGLRSSVSGGDNRSVIGDSDWRAGSLFEDF